MAAGGMPLEMLVAQLGLGEIGIGLGEKAVFVSRSARLVRALVKIALVQQFFREGAVDLVEHGLNVLLGGEFRIFLLYHHQLRAGIDDIAGVELDAAELRQRGERRTQFYPRNLVAVGVTLDVSVVGVFGEIVVGVVEIIIGGARRPFSARGEPGDRCWIRHII